MATFTYTNSTGLTLPDTGAIVQSQSLDVYGTSGLVTNVSIQLTGLSHTFPNDLDMLLVGPNGINNLEFLSDAGDGSDVSGDYTFEDGGPSAPSTNVAPLTPGTYGPTTFDDAEIDATYGTSTGGINHAGTGNTFASSFSGINANGTWNLYVNDDFPNFDGGSLTAWATTITTDSSIAAITGTASADTFAVANTNATDGEWAFNGDTVQFTGVTGFTIEGGGGSDDLIGGSGDDTFIWNTGDGGDTLDGNVGSDTFDSSNTNLNQIIDLSGTGTSTIGADAFALDRIENVITGDGDDEVTDDDSSNVANTIRTGDGDDTIIKTAGTTSVASNTFDGGIGNDTLIYDNLVANSGTEVNLSTGKITFDGSDRDVVENIENVTLINVNGNIVGDDEDNILRAEGTAYDNEMFGGAGVDSLFGGDGDDILEGGIGGDTINGEGGNDTASYETSAAAVLINLGSNLIGGGDANGDTLIDIENLIGSANDDLLTGDMGDNIIEGGAGGDTIDGGGAGPLGDTASYAGSTERVNVRLFQDTATGGDATGDELNNIQNLIGSDYNDILFGDVGVSRLDGGLGEDNLNGSNGDDFLNGGGDDDKLTGGQGADFIDGGSGTGDEARYATSNEAVVIDLAADTATGGHADGDELDNIENLFGSGFGDTLTGDSQDNRLDGFNGNDTLVGGDGADFLFGGTGSDTADYTDSGMTAVTVKLNTFSGVGGTAEGDELRAIENVIGSAAGDTINGSTGTNTLTGAGGDDTLNGLNGNDFLYGGDNDDTLIGGRGGDLIDGGDGIDTARYANSDGLIRIDLGAGTTGGAGHAFNDTLVDIENIFGSAFNDVITGDDGVNDLNGYNGNDRLNGGLGDDVLTGGFGADRFIFTDVSFGQDTITDFANNQDKLDFTALGLDYSDFFAIQSGADTVLVLTSDQNQTLTLENVVETTIDQNDFL